MKKICGICNLNIVYSKTKGYCANCNRIIQIKINSRISKHKEATRFFFSTAKQRIEKRDFYYNTIKICLDELNKIDQEYHYIVKKTKGTSEYIQEANKTLKIIEAIMLKME